MPVRLTRVRGAANGVNDMLTIEHAHQAVNARGVGQQLGLVPLHQAAGDDDALHMAGVFQVNGAVDLGQALGLAGFQEAAGVNDDGVGGFLIRRNGDAVRRQQAEHALAVNEVFRAAKADEGDGLNVIGLLRHESRS